MTVSIGGFHSFYMQNWGSGWCQDSWGAIAANKPCVLWFEIFLNCCFSPVLLLCGSAGVPDFNARLFCEEIWWSLSSSSNGASGRGSSGSSSSTAFKAPEAGVINVAFVTPAGSPAAPLPLAPPAALSGLLPIIGRVFPTLADVQIAASLAAAHAAAAEDAAEAVGEAAAAEAGAADEAAAEEAAARILIPGAPLLLCEAC